MRPCGHTDIYEPGRILPGQCGFCWMFFNVHQFYEQWQDGETWRWKPAPPKPRQVRPIKIEPPREGDCACGKERNTRGLL